MNVPLPSLSLSLSQEGAREREAGDKSSDKTNSIQQQNIPSFGRPQAWFHQKNPLDFSSCRTRKISSFYFLFAEPQQTPCVISPHTQPSSFTDLFFRTDKACGFPGVWKGFLVLGKGIPFFCFGPPKHLPLVSFFFAGGFQTLFFFTPNNIVCNGFISHPPSN